MTVFKFTGQWIIAKNIESIMGLQATATKRKLELDDVNKSCEVEDRCQDEQHSNDELNVDEVDGSVSPPKITKYELPEAAFNTSSTGQRLAEAQQEYGEQTKSSISIIEKAAVAEEHAENSRSAVMLEAPTAAAEEDINVQELTNECKSTYISHSLVQPMIVEDSIAKLEAVVVPGEIIAPWTAPADPQVAMDSISRLQAVAVPDEGSDGTRSALATTLLSDDLCDDDDDDFDDDFDEDDHLPPRYHHCPPAPRSSQYGNSGSGYSSKLQTSPPHSYYMDYPQLCSSRANGQQATYNNRVYNWQQSYGYEQQQQQPLAQPQQTIRCAENGKSYLELGSSSNSSSTATPSSPAAYNQMNGHHMHQMHRPAPSVTPHHPHYHHPSSSYGHHPHHPHHHHPHHHPSAAMKRCCDGRPSTWCQSNNKQCYKDRRMSMLNLSMFKLSRFRQVSEQSLYRSVLICNTLKQIEREIEIENKEAQAAARQHQQQQMHLHAMHQQQLHHLQQQQQQQQQQGPSVEQSYSNNSSQVNLYQRQTTTSPVFSSQHQPQHLHHNQLHSPVHHHHQQPQHHFQSNTTDGLTYSSQSNSNNSSGSLDHLASPSALPVSSSSSSSSPPSSPSSLANGGITGFTFGASSNSRNNGASANTAHQQNPLMPFNDSLPPYDNPHPLRDTSSGRATPFPVANGSQSDADSGFGDEDCTRPINWGSVLSLSALDPLAGSDLFATGASPLTPISAASPPSTMAGLPPTNIENGTTTSSAHLKVLSSVKDQSAVTQAVSGSDGGDSGISMMDEDEDDESSSGTQLLSIGSSSSITTVTNSVLRTTTATSSCSSELLPSWLDMESELTELLPSWKLTPLSADDILKSVPHQSQQSMEPTRIVHESDMETGFTHIMVVS